MSYLELQHGPSCVGVKQQTVGSYAGAWITCILNGGLCKNNNSGHGLDFLLRAVLAVCPVTSCCKKSVCFRLPRCAWLPAPNSVRWTWEWCADMADRWQASSSEPHELHPAEPLPGFRTPGDGVLSHMSKNVVHMFDVTVSQHETVRTWSECYPSFML